MSLSQFFSTRNKTNQEQNEDMMNLLQNPTQIVEKDQIPPVPRNDPRAKQRENRQKKIMKPEKGKNESIQQEQKQKVESQQVQQEKAEENLQATVFVGNVPLSSTHKEIKKFFISFGQVEKVWFRSIPTEESKLPRKASHILKKYKTGADSMNAYVKFVDIQSAKKACDANGSMIGQNNIRVTMCKQFSLDYERTAFVGNLYHGIRDQELWNAFNQTGKVESVRVIRNKNTLQGIGIGYIKFVSAEDMKQAIKSMNGVEIRERKIRVKKAVPPARLEKKVQKIKAKKSQNKTIPQNKVRNSKRTGHLQGAKYPAKRKFIKKPSK